MGYDLKPRNKELESFHFGAFSWSWMLDAGVGLVISTGRSADGGYSYAPDKRGASPRSCDGYYVTAEEANALGHAATGLASVETFIAEQWAALSDDERAKWEAANVEYRRELYRKPVRADFIKRAEEFGQWALRSHGFWIH